MPMIEARSAYQSVYEVVEELCSGDAIPVGLSGTLFSALDQLRQARAPRAEIGLAEGISVAMHKLEWAIRSNDLAAQTRLRGELQQLGSDWLDTPICRH